MTGGAFGYCAGYSAPGFANPLGTGRGMAWGRGGGVGLGLAHRRRRGGFRPLGMAAGPTPMDEKTALQAHLKSLENALFAVKARLDDIEAKETETDA